MYRILFAITQGLRYRQSLTQIKRHAYGSIYDLDLVKIKNQNIDYLVFDFDGVLSGHGEAIPQKNTLPILQKSIEIFGKKNVFILTNKPLASRELFFKENFPDIRFIYAKRKKPYPDGLQEIIEITQADAQKIGLIDDRLLTGGLATCLANTKMIYINKPLQNFHHGFFAECFFHCLRILEKTIF